MKQGHTIQNNTVHYFTHGQLNLMRLWILTESIVLPKRSVQMTCSKFSKGQLFILETSRFTRNIVSVLYYLAVSMQIS